MRRLMDVYCKKPRSAAATTSLSSSKTSKVNPDKTPDEIGLEDGDEIYVMPAQTGS
jgi:hypothetical protein